MKKEQVKTIVKYSIEHYNAHKTNDANTDIYLLLNNCLGLIIAPVEYNKEKGNTLFRIDLNNGWGIDSTHIKHSTGVNVQEVAGHLRDAISHLQFSYDEQTQIVRLWVTNSMLSAMSFEITLQFEDLESFVLKFAQYFLDKC